MYGARYAIIMRAVEKSKLFAARWLYRWQSASGILGAVFAALTFAGVFTLILGPVLGPLGIGYSETLLLLVGFVVALFLGFGFFLDRIVKFWTAQAYVGTVRNPWLYDQLYQKELLNLKERDVPTMLAVREILADGGRHPELVAALDAKIARIERAVRDKKWTVEPGEEAYASDH